MNILKDLFSSKPEKTTLGICLSGGGALGFAHIGVLQALEDHGIFPDQVSGASMGTIIGTLYSAGYTPGEMLQMIRDQKLYKVTKLMTFRPTFLKSGLSTHTMLRELIRELVPHNSFEGLKRKMHICVVNLNTAQWEIIEAGEKLDKWVAASSSIPGVFESIRFGQQFYVDGGLLNNLPAQGLKSQCDTIIGVDVIPHKVPVELKKPIDALAFSVRAMQFQNSTAGRNLCNYLIEPDAISEFHEFSFDAYQTIFQYGYSAATKCIVDNPEMMKLREL